jgi:hypothetical protein
MNILAPLDWSYEPEPWIEEDPKWPLIKGLIPIVMISAIATAGAIYWAVRAVWG